MKILIVTQKLDKDDENLGAFYYWFEEMARRVDEVVIIADVVKSDHLPANMRCYSMGKGEGKSRWLRLINLWKLFWRHYRSSDAVLYHMIPEFVLATIPFLIFWPRKSALWYAHKGVTWRLQLAEKIITYIFTSSPASFRLPSKKIFILGQGINTSLFALPSESYPPPRTLRLISLGRIAPIKDYETVIRACAILKITWDYPWVLSIVGGPILLRDYDYLSSLKNLVEKLGLSSRINFYGARPYAEIPSLFQQHDMFVSLSQTGSLDKAGLEAMASGLTVISANEAYRSILPSAYFLEKVTPETLAERIKIFAFENRPNMALRKIVVERHSLESVVGKIINIFMHDRP